MKKWLSVLLSAMMILLAAGAALAVDTPKGAITVTNVEKWEHVDLYQVIQMTFDEAKGQYNAVAWTNSVSGWSGLTGKTPEQAPTGENNSEAKTFYEGMYAYLTDAANNVKPTVTQQSTADSPATLTFSGLEAGSYLIVIHGGARKHQPYLASLKPEQNASGAWSFAAAGASVDATTKSETPRIDKRVNQTNVGVTDVVGFTIDADVPKYADGATGVNYWIADIADDGFDLVANSLNVYGLTGETQTGIGSGSYTVTNQPTLENVGAGKKGLFRIDFTYDDIKAYDKVRVTYQAKVNGSIAAGAADNDNEARFEWGSEKTRVYTYGLKVDKSDSRDENTKLDGVKFNLLDKDGKALTFVYDAARRVYSLSESGNIELVTADGGRIQIDGLAAGTYKLVETEPLQDYNKIAPIDVVLTADTQDPTKLENSNSGTKDAYYQVAVRNGRGMIIPSTGGMGTTIFMVAGIAVMACAVVALLVVLKRQKRSEG